ncbi:MAG: phosphoglycerate mutase (2,3-diphosphoglycerate-independent) [Candidatus Pacebacteria bacterium CG11_big_fil_rev_8_21_14_0_20_34_55]|nr:2,3-bisphosphoglycerate-independent phosphoglycerate mutase [Candidatus Pacearchaeota archaeon]NCQ65725.1 2,3-bisphosphoglycerate-independent phosphoglycerate mutase [Candidatus Paceibacterota bacterium]NCS86517.1 2,3-bisphosphoglycerate-independent phosphoglycerate mutase [Candidatus Paceibacterota bacterium]PIQ81263.1 MAG: phosphoglycerate mutase (2,3-diphosphoglycerate-independent) [Candidatus Pacebacteria bacterium CG11_big_fil_rev_8_21_14_0_20_34_55]PJC43741.1 MAG: 2,3-bisphosphoglycera
MNDLQNKVPISVLSNQFKITTPEEDGDETTIVAPQLDQKTSEVSSSSSDLPARSTAPILSSLPFNDSAPRASYNGPKPVALLILDGWGIGPDNAGNAVTKANTPNMDKYWIAFPHTQLTASGEAVGLPRGKDGNTETGHLNIGAGHIVYQDLPRINMSIANGSFYQNEALLNAINHSKKNNSTLHLMGLIGAGGVHSNIEHLYALLNLCKQQQMTNVMIHGFTDGRDSPPTSGINYVQQIMDNCKILGVGEIATLMGRYFAMDRDKRWERIEKSYYALTIGNEEACTTDPIAAMKAQYDKGVTDEYIEPINICDTDGTHRIIKSNDAVIFFNYRIDRPRELTRAFVMPDFETGIKHEAFDPYSEKYNKTNIQKNIKNIETFDRKIKLENLYFTTMTKYEEGLPTDVAFPPQNIKNPLCKVISENGLRQLRTTETEKERFVTYYMNGQAETMYPGEDRVIIPSKGVKSYDQAPEMSAYEIAEEMIKRIEKNEYDVIIANICNGDMVGHTGNFEASVKACEIVDDVVGKIVSHIIARGGVVLITADHGNVEELINNDTGEVDTEHSAYPVPLMIIGKQYMGQSIMLPTGILADIAPTILKILGISKPSSMTGRALI